MHCPAPCAHGVRCTLGHDSGGCGGERGRRRVREGLRGGSATATNAWLLDGRVIIGAGAYLLLNALLALLVDFPHGCASRVALLVHVSLGVDSLLLGRNICTAVPATRTVTRGSAAEARMPRRSGPGSARTSAPPWHSTWVVQSQLLWRGSKLSESSAEYRYRYRHYSTGPPACAWHRDRCQSAKC